MCKWQVPCWAAQIPIQPPLPLPVTRCIYQSSPDSDIFKVLDPVYRGQHKFLNGQKKTCKDPPFLYTTPAPNRARSLPTTNRTSICNRICTVPCKPVSQEKKFLRSKFVRPLKRGLMMLRKKNINKSWVPCGKFFSKIFAGVCFCGLAIFLSFARTNFCD